MENLKVLFHLNETDKWKATLNNLNNFIKGGENYNKEIVVVVNGEAVKGYLKGTDKMDNIISLYKSGVKFVACNNSLKGNNILKEDMLELVEVVPVGVIFITLMQKEGYGYIKP